MLGEKFHFFVSILVLWIKVAFFSETDSHGNEKRKSGLIQANDRVCLQCSLTFNVLWGFLFCSCLLASSIERDIWSWCGDNMTRRHTNKKLLTQVLAYLLFLDPDGAGKQPTARCRINIFYSWSPNSWHLMPEILFLTVRYPVRIVREWDSLWSNFLSRNVLCQKPFWWLFSLLTFLFMAFPLVTDFTYQHGWQH